MDTCEYRIGQFNMVEPTHSGYKPKIKITGVYGETKWMDITWEEFQAIKDLLTEGK